MSNALFEEIDKDLKSYIEQDILPRYDTFDKAHQRDHVNMVIEQSLFLAQFYDVDINMVYAIAAYHDTGLVEGRKFHHLVSGNIIRHDEKLVKWFDEEQIEIMAQSAEDHRAYADHEPRTIYGKIVAEADRCIDNESIVRRTVQYGLSNYSELDEQEQIERALDHLNEKYSEGGYLKLWIPESPNAERLHDLHQLIKDKKRIRKMIKDIYEEEILRV